MSLNVDVLRSSFAAVEPRALQFAARFYENLFRMYPATKPLFAKVDIARQQEKLVSSLALVVANLSHPQALTAELEALARRHVSYRVESHHYEMVGAALLQTFNDELGPSWTTETRKAWADAYQVISDVMLKATKH